MSEWTKLIADEEQSMWSGQDFEKTTANDFQTNKNLFLKNIIMVNLLFDFIESRKKLRDRKWHSTRRLCVAISLEQRILNETQTHEQIFYNSFL